MNKVNKIMIATKAQEQCHQFFPLQLLMPSEMRWNQAKGLVSDGKGLLNFATNGSFFLIKQVSSIMASVGSKI